MIDKQEYQIIRLFRAAISMKVFSKLTRRRGPLVHINSISSFLKNDTGRLVLLQFQSGNLQLARMFSSTTEGNNQDNKNNSKGKNNRGLTDQARSKGNYFGHKSRKQREGQALESLDNKELYEKKKLNLATNTSYKPSTRVSMIIKTSANDEINSKQKEIFASSLKDAANGLFKNFKKDNLVVNEATEQFKISASKMLDGMSFTNMIKLIQELRNDVIDNPKHRLTPESFLIFLDKFKSISANGSIIDFLISKVGEINIDALDMKSLMNCYQKHSLDFKFEANLRIDEIKSFAQGVIPEPRFIFDHYQTSLTNPKGATQSQQNQEKQNQDEYFSFFNNHEKVILQPESNFKNLRQFIEFLPIDYYILLQEGFDKKECKFQKSNYVFFNNLPLLVQRQRDNKDDKGLKLVHQITFQDVKNTESKQELASIINDPFATDYTLDHLEKKFGAIKNLFFINYNLNTYAEFRLATQKSIQNDKLGDFQKTFDRVINNQSSQNEAQEEGLDDDDDFEELVQQASAEFMHNSKKSKRKDPQAEGKPERRKSKSQLKLEEKMEEARKYLTEQRTNEINEKIRDSEIKALGLENTVKRTGFIEFKRYEDKLKFMQHPMYLFGLKLFNQDKNIEFVDADFCNIVTVEGRVFVGKPLSFACETINEYLIKNGYKGKGFQVGKLRGINDFDLNNIIVKDETFKITLRFNSFFNALEAIKILSKLIDKEKNVNIISNFFSPFPNYYDGKFASKFETCIKGKFEGLDDIVEVESNYAQVQLEKIIKSKENELIEESVAEPAKQKQKSKPKKVVKTSVIAERLDEIQARTDSEEPKHEQIAGQVKSSFKSKSLEELQAQDDEEEYNLEMDRKWLKQEIGIDKEDSRLQESKKI